MSAQEWLGLVAALGNLALAILSVVRGRESAVARPLALLCLALCAWNFASVAESASVEGPWWGVFDAIFTALSPPLLLELVATFVGRKRARVRIIAVAYVVFGALALSSAPGFFWAWGRAWAGSSAWALVFLAGFLPTLAIVLTWLVQHLTSTRLPDEKARTRTFLAAFAFGGGLSAIDEVFTALGLPAPHLASLGTIVGTFLVAAAVFRFRLLDRDLSANAAVYAVTLASAGLITFLVVFQAFGGNVAILTGATIVVTFALVIAAREVAASRAAQRERLERLTVLGRLSAQMAHDIKNPLAALLGAARLLEETGDRLPRDQQREFLRLLVDQAGRIRAIVDKYERIGRVEPVATRVQINDVVRRVVGAQALSTTGVEVGLELSEVLPECDADVDLVASALENVVRNAFEAMPRGGSLRVRTHVDAPAAGGKAVVVQVQDTGEGMDPRRAERAFDDFFTTKATGSGLGLAFVRRVALAHGGNVSLTSSPGEGTTVVLRFPAGGGDPGA
jgi:signal transduction histidine kinase